MKYIAGPWKWAEVPGIGMAYTPPTGTVAVVDLRTIPAQSVGNHSAGVGSGFFACPDDFVVPSEYEVLATEHIRDAKVAQEQRAAWQGLFGVSIPGSVDKLIDCLAYTLTDGADPEGLTAPKPICPGVAPEQDAQIHLAGHSVVWRQAVNVPGGQSRHERSIRELIRKDIAKIANEDPDPDLWRRVLGDQKRKYGQKWDDDAEDWIVPASLKARGKGRNGRTVADEPKTSYTESWPTNGAVTSGQDRTWTYFERSNLLVASNELTLNENSNWNNIRMNSALSSADTYSQSVVVANGTSCSVSLSVRKGASDSELTYYFLNIAQNSGFTIYKRVTGTYTSLFNASGTTVATDVMREESSGSTQTGRKNGTSVVSGTDTAITAGVYCGIGMWKSNTTAQYDSWEAGDLGGGAANPKGVFGLAMNGPMRRVVG